MGKTARTAFLFQTTNTPEDVIRSLITDLGVEPCNYNLGDLQRQVGKLLFQESKLGKRVVVAIDEAQNLEDAVLEILRMLSNYETRKAKLLQIIMAGQPQLADRLASPRMEQLRQRLAVVARCRPLDEEDIHKYIDHRLRIAGYRGGPIFAPEALELIVAESKGVPRTINNICFHALSLGCAKLQQRIDAETLQEVIADLSLQSTATWQPETWDRPRKRVAVGGSPTKPSLQQRYPLKPAVADGAPRKADFRIANIGEDLPGSGLEAQSSSPEPSAKSSPSTAAAPPVRMPLRRSPL